MTDVILHLLWMVSIYSKPCVVVYVLSTHNVCVLFELAALRDDVVATLAEPTLSVAIRKIRVGIIVTSRTHRSDRVYNSRPYMFR